MLVLTRRIEQSLAIGGATGFQHLLKITVLGIGRGTVRLGFEVDSSVPVHRWEVWEKIHSSAPTDGSADDVQSPIVN